MIAAVPAHAPALAALHGLAYAPSDEPGHPSEAWNEAAFATLLAMPGVFGWISERGGMILARIALDEAEILTLAVDPAWRGRGIGGALLDRAMRVAGARGALSMVLEVATGNAAALALYCGRGFAEVGRRQSYYANGSDALLLRAAIPSGCIPS